MQYDTLVIRKSNNKDLFLFQNKEKVYFLTKYGQTIDNGLDYDRVSDAFNKEEQYSQ